MLTATRAHARSPTPTLTHCWYNTDTPLTLKMLTEDSPTLLPAALPLRSFHRVVTAQPLRSHRAFIHCVVIV
jgi:hypothetical protein